MEFLSAIYCTLTTPLEITRNHNYTRSLVLLVGKLLGADLVAHIHFNFHKMQLNPCAIWKFNDNNK